MPNVEFTFEWSRSLLDRLRSAGYRFRSFDEHVGTGDVLLRHDVDLSPERALSMAQLEHDLGISATYFFLLGSPLYNPMSAPVRNAINGIASLGHDVGLHFSTHQYWPTTRPPEAESIEAAVDREREVLATVVPDAVPTVSFHLPPPWVLRRTFDGFPSAYEPRFFEKIDYVADSGQRWRDDGVSIPEDGRPLQVLIHPGLWGEADGMFVERIRESVGEADHRIAEYVRSRHLEPELIRQPQVEAPEA